MISPPLHLECIKNNPRKLVNPAVNKLVCFVIVWKMFLVLFRKSCGENFLTPPLALTSISVFTKLLPPVKHKNCTRQMLSLVYNEAKSDLVLRFIVDRLVTELE